MSEDNILRPAFGVPRAGPSVPVSQAVSVQSEPLNFEQDVLYCLSNLETVWSANLRGDEMTNYLFDDVGYNKTDTSLELRRPVVRTYTFEQFCGYLLSSSRAQWRAQPAFYGALFIEFHERQNLILESLDNYKEQVKLLSLEDAKIILKLASRAEAG